MEHSKAGAKFSNWWSFFGGLAVLLVVFFAVFYLVENERGARRLEEVEAALRARGESLNWRDLVPPAVEGDQNLAAIPLLRPIWATLLKGSTRQLEDTPEGRKLEELNLTEKLRDRPRANMAKGELSDPIAWQKYFAESKKFPHPEVSGDTVKDVLIGLDLFKPELDALRAEAGKRPVLQFPIDYRDGVQMRLSHWGKMQKIVEVLALRASILLSANRSEEAFADVELAQHLVATPEDERTLISWLVSITCEGIIRKPIWEGLETHRWTAAQLSQLQTAQLARNDLDYFQKTIRLERVFSMDIYRQISRDRSKFSELLLYGPPINPVAKIIFQLPPRGWVLQNEALQADLTQRYVVDAFDSVGKTAKFPGRMDSAISNEPFFYTMLAKISLPVYDNVVIRAGQAQSDLHQTAIACALERFRLDHDRFPASLDELTPNYLTVLPHDIITGTSMIYSSDGATFRLYSVGWNCKDDGGKTGFKTPAGMIDREEGDWVWPHRIPPPQH